MLSTTFSVSLLLCLISDFTYGRNIAASVGDDYTYIKSIDSYYKIHTTPKQWRDAKLACAQEGGSLLYPENSDEANAVIKFWKQYQNSTPVDDTWVYVGMSDIITEGVYETIHGKPITEVYNNWNVGMPDNRDDEDCIHLNQEGIINDVRCDAEYSFICKKNINQNCTCEIEHSEASKEGYNTYIEAADSYYKIHTTPKQWRDAKLACAQEGGSLLYPENSDEANAVIKFWKQYQNSTPVEDTWVYVGMSDIITEGVYETIHGKSISDVYNHWKVGMPDNSGDEDCIHLNQGGVINDIRCNEKYSFICKKSLKQPCTCEIEKTTDGGQRDKKFFRKDYTYIESVQSFYKIHTIGRTFADARRMCSLEGASLYYADDVDEMKAVASFWNRTQPSIPWVFVGLTDEIAEGLFETVDQRPISEVYSMWHPYQPDNTGGKEDCVHMDLKGSMNDYLCDSKAKFICKKRLNSLLWNNICEMPNLDYSYNNGKCYKLHTTPMNWTDAYAMCRIEYTSLAVISNKNEADYIAKLIQSTPTPRVCGQYQRGIYHVGFHNRNKDGWQTVKGTPMNVDPEMWFDNYQPDGDLYEECGSIYFDGRLINTKCDMKSLFICEKEVDSSNRTTGVNQNEENIF